MQSNTLYRNLAFVIFTLVTLSFAGVGWGQASAAPAAETSDKNTDAGKDKKGEDNESERAAIINRNDTAFARKEANCERQHKEINDAIERCPQRCISNLDRCMDNIASNQGLTTGVLDVLLTAYAGSSVGSSAQSTKCDLSPEEWKTDKEKLEKEVKDGEDKINEINRKLAENSEKYAKDDLALDEKLAAELEKASAKQDELDAQLRDSDEKMIATGNKQQAELSALQKAQAAAVKARDTIFRSARARLLLATDASIKRTCLSQARDVKKKMSGSSNYSGSGNAIQAGNNRKKEIREAYDNCLTAAYEQKRNILADADSEIADKKAEIENLDKAIEGQQALASKLAENMGNAAEQLKKQKRETAARSMDTRARIQQEKANLLASKNLTEKNLNKELTDAQKRLVQKQNLLNSVGSKPVTYGAKKDTTITSDYDAFKKGLEGLDRFKRDCCSEKEWVVAGIGREVSKPGKSPYFDDRLCKSNSDLKKTVEDISSKADSGR